MPCWYFDKSELSNTPSRKDGIDAETESRYRREGARFLMDCGNSMGLRYDTMATGVVFYHRFYLYHSFNDFPRYVMATCCLFLAGKVEETPKKCKDIIKAAKTYLESKNMKKHSDSFGEDPIKEIMTHEKILLQTIKFDLQVDHPYAYLLKYAKTLKGDQEQIRSMVQMAWAFINDSYCTTLCLQWEPEIIAIALMYLTSKLSKFEITDWIDKKDTSFKQNWWDQFVQDLGVDILEDICHQILDLYATQQQQVNKNTATSQTNKITNPNPTLSSNNQTISNKRKSPPDSLTLTPNSSLSSVGYNEPASPTSAKLMKNFNETQNQQQYQQTYQYYNQQQQHYLGQHQPPIPGTYTQPPPPPPPHPSQASMILPYHYNYYSTMMPGTQYPPPPPPPIPSNVYPPSSIPNKPVQTFSMHQSSMDNMNHIYQQNHHHPHPSNHHQMYNSIQSQYNVNINSTSSNSGNSVTTSSTSSLRSSALKTVNISDRPI